MVATFKSEGLVVQVAAAGSLSVPIPARVLGDVTALLVNTNAGGTAPLSPVPTGYAEQFALSDGASGAIHILTRRSTATEAGANLAVTVPGAAYAIASVWTGASATMLASALLVGTFQTTSYLESVALTLTNRAIWHVGLLYAANTAGAVTNNGTITSTNTIQNFQVLSGAVGGNQRISTVTSAVTSAAGGTVRRAIGTAADNVTLSLLISDMPAGGFTSSYSWGAAIAGGSRDSDGGFTAAYGWGPGTATGSAAAAGGFAAGYDWGAAVFEGESPAGGGFATTLEWGPATFTGQLSPATGGFTTGYQWGDAVFTGATSYAGGFTTAYSWGPAEVGGLAPAGGGFTAAWEWGQAVFGGSSAAGGGFTASYGWDSATFGGTTAAAGDFAISYRWGDAVFGGSGDPGADCWPRMGLVPLGPSVTLWSLGPNVTLTPESTTLVLAPLGPTLILVEDGCRP